jgi:hypothetical protein
VTLIAPTWLNPCMVAPQRYRIVIAEAIMAQ